MSESKTSSEIGFGATNPNGSPAAPFDRLRLQAEMAAGRDMLRALCNGEVRWLLHMPARPDEDPDLVISRALSAGQRVFQELDAATKENQALRASLAKSMAAVA